MGYVEIREEIKINELVLYHYNDVNKLKQQ